MQEEIWKDIPNYFGYMASNLGNIKSIDRIIINKANRSGVAHVKGVLLKQSTNIVSKYKFVNLFGKPQYVHKLIAIAFLEHISNGHTLVVDHIDNNRANNLLDNLQIITQRQNTSKDKKNCTSKYTGVYFNKKIKKWTSNIRINGIKKNLGNYNCELKAHCVYINKLKMI